ncbi:MAG: hypothetical protein AABZ06_07005 [Bdellovibrionota bacterium]
MQFEKQFVERELLNYVSPYQDPFIYRSVTEDGISRLGQLFEAIIGSSLSRDDQDISHEELLKELIDLAGSDFDPSWWLMAYLDGRPSGFILPQRHPVKLYLGTIFHLGILPGLRGKKYGRI